LRPYEANPIEIEKVIQALKSDQLFLEALYISSPDLYEQIGRIEIESLKDQKHERLLIAVLKYYLRMSYRCTPYGLLAGVSVGRIGDGQRFTLGGTNSNKRYTRIDMDCLCSIATKISESDVGLKNLLFFPNNTLYRQGNSYRYVERENTGSRNKYNLSKVEFSSPLEKVIEKASQGIRFDQILALLGEFDVDNDDSEQFVRDLVNNQILVSELTVNLTGNEYLYSLIGKVSKNDSFKKWEDCLLNLEVLIRQADKLNSRDRQWHELYNQIEQILQSVEVKFDKSKMIQVDVFKPLVYESELNFKVVKELLPSIEFLTSVFPRNKNEKFEKFTKAFFERYEYNEIPLNEALDCEFGLGYPAFDVNQYDNSPLLDGIIFGGNNQLSDSQINPIQKVLDVTYFEAISKGEKVINLDESKFKDVVSPTEIKRLPRSMYSLVSILSRSYEEICKGNFKIYHDHTKGPSAASILGRFGHLDKEIENVIKEEIVFEESHDKQPLYAEIIHINQSRTGNIATRPRLREYEIPILAASSSPFDKIIDLNDIMVSMRGGRLLLRSKKHDREVIPCLSNAHNHTVGSIPAYQFLCDFQTQMRQALVLWDWGHLLSMPYLPRVEFGKVILSKERWLLDSTEIENSKKEDTNSLRNLFKAKKVARFVVVSDGDNKLPLDLENDYCLKLIFHIANSRKQIVLEENLFSEDTLWLTAEEGHFTNEFVFCLRNKVIELNKSYLEIVSEINEKTKGTQRHFTLGSEWLYVKIYCGVTNADSILTNHIFPITSDLLNRGMIDKWFFIRYSDPKHHLRIRFHGTANFYEEVIKILNNVLQVELDTSLINKIEFDTYTRELERYGFSNIQNCEDFFYVDSIFVSKVISGSEGISDEVRWKIAIKSVDSMLGDFGLTLDEKKNLMKGLQEKYKNIVKLDEKLSKKTLSVKYRNLRKEINDIISGTCLDLGQVKEALHERSLDLTPIIKNIIIDDDILSKKNKLVVLLESLIHMNLNRLFRSKQNQQEAVVYDFLHQCYKNMQHLQARNN
jgi:thiopeptide-type bacteriocin biosynthesis protein